ncbi:nucleolar protein [Savitreella phatthalungensis]
MVKRKASDLQGKRASATASASAPKAKASRTSTTVAPAQSAQSLDDDFTAFDAADDSSDEESASSEDDSSDNNVGDADDDADESGVEVDADEGIDSEEEDDSVAEDAEESDDSDDEAAQDDRIVRLSDLTPNINDALTSARQRKSKSASSQPGVVYIGRVPHGFYEDEMRGYFAQFGEVLRVRVSRSKKSGRSKGYAFVEFGERDVATVVARSMHNYLLGGKLLQVKVLSGEEVKAKGGQDQIFKGAGRKFKHVPWAAIERSRLDKPRTKQQWDKLQQREDRRRKDANKRIKAAGIDYEYSR